MNAPPNTRPHNSMGMRAFPNRFAENGSHATPSCTPSRHDPPPECIRHVQAALLRADHVVLIFPVWNGAMPALVKGFLEQTFRPAFTFPDVKAGERLGFQSAFTQRKALHGKTARTVVTMQMPAFVYRWYFHPHPEKNTLRLAGLQVDETFIGLVEAGKPARREQWMRRIHALGRMGQSRCSSDSSDSPPLS